MKTFILLIVLFISCNSSTSLVGNWYGVIDTNQGQLNVTIKVTQNSDDSYQIKIDNPKMNQFDLEASEISFNKNVLQLKIPSLGASYLGELSEDGQQLNGIVTMADGLELVLDSKIMKKD